MALRAPPLPVSAVLVVVGLLALAAVALVTLHLGGRFNAQGPYVSVPATVDLDLEPGVPYAVYRELAGTHVTTNNPLEDTPPDLAITVTDADTGDPIETRPDTWWARQNIFGSMRHRVALRRFTAPPSGRVTVSIQAGFQHPQVFAVAPSFDKFKDDYTVPIAAAFTAAGLIVLLGLALAIARVAAAPDLDPDLPP